MCMITPRNNTLQIIFEQTVVILCLLTPTRSVRKHFTWGVLQWHISSCDLKCLTYCGCSVYYNEVYDSWDVDLYKIYYFCGIDSFQRWFLLWGRWNRNSEETDFFFLSLFDVQGISKNFWDFQMFRGKGYTVVSVTHNPFMAYFT